MVQKFQNNIKGLRSSSFKLLTSYLKYLNFQICQISKSHFFLMALTHSHLVTLLHWWHQVTNVSKTYISLSFINRVGGYIKYENNMCIQRDSLEYLRIWHFLLKIWPLSLAPGCFKRTLSESSLDCLCSIKETMIWKF